LHEKGALLEHALERLGPERVAAFFVEPVIGAGGVYPPSDGYIDAVADVCRQAGVLLIIDAVICAFGRLGTWFGIERWGVQPDMIVFAKGVTSGYLPLGGVVVSDRVAEPFWSGPGAPVLRPGATYAGHRTCCAAALANLDILERERLVSRGRELSEAYSPSGRRPCKRKLGPRAVVTSGLIPTFDPHSQPVSTGAGAVHGRSSGDSVERRWSRQRIAATQTGSEDCGCFQTGARTRGSRTA
jgi:adenosylmethionine-8-amino-7-oxononanoate aminotransferase